MRTAGVIARYLLGLTFTIFGLNGFLQFIHQPPPTNPMALQFLIASTTSHFSAFFFAVQLPPDCCCFPDTSYLWRSSCWLPRSITFLPSISRWRRQRLALAS